mmetsp:Transcript_26211/g.34998  ORF Transcript_26211/g.34998 Transcript_26211/m.34998 type:complete len:81 (+) Transcript_26211:129-371(+)
MFLLDDNFDFLGDHRANFISDNFRHIDHTGLRLQSRGDGVQYFDPAFVELSVHALDLNLRRPNLHWQTHLLRFTAFSLQG